MIGILTWMKARASSSMVFKETPLADLADFIVTDLELLELPLGEVLVSDFLLLANAMAITTRASKNLKPYMVMI